MRMSGQLSENMQAMEKMPSDDDFQPDHPMLPMIQKVS
jgi:hypothetical protein